MRAVIQDQRGRPIFGSQVEWSAEGTPVVLESAADLGGPDYAVFSDACLPPPESPTPRSVVLTATLGEFTESLTYSWTAMPDPEALASFEPDELCPSLATPQDDSGTEREAAAHTAVSVCPGSCCSWASC